MSKAKELAKKFIRIPKLEDGWDDIADYKNAVASAFAQQHWFIEGYKQAKEEMMKNAVEADIAESFTPVSESPNIYMHGFTCVYEEKESTSYVVAPCKVKLIIIKD